jgi:hypothetical protein
MLDLFGANFGVAEMAARCALGTVLETCEAHNHVSYNSVSLFSHFIEIIYWLLFTKYVQTTSHTTRT